MRPTKGGRRGYAKLYSWDNMLVTTGSLDPKAPAEIVPAGPNSAQAWFNCPNEFADLNESLNGNYPIADPGALGQNQPPMRTKGPGRFAVMESATRIS